MNLFTKFVASSACICRVGSLLATENSDESCFVSGRDFSRAAGSEKQ
jgi:hypothetical protein